ncbi:MAG TPA: VCBS repeat-containing protein [Verrucomicrobiae bacterium]
MRPLKKNAEAAPSLPWPMLLVVGGVCLVLGLLLGRSPAADRSGKAPSPIVGKQEVSISADRPPVTTADELALGEKLSQQVCAACHLRPEPEVLDRITWAMEVLPSMADWLGMNPGGTNALDLDPRVREANILPSSPAMSVEEWRAICTYYLANAPVGTAAATNRPQIEIGLKHFQVQPSPERVGAAATLVKIDPLAHKIYYGESGSNTLMVLSGQGKREFAVNFSSPPVDLQFAGEDLLVTLMGSYVPSDLLEAKVIKVGNPERGGGALKEVLTGLPRSAATLLADINKDGRQDLVHCGYGNILGRLAWYEGKADGTYVEHPIIERPGAGSARIHDFNGDGWPDIAVSMAQAREGIYVCVNDKKGGFDIQPVAEYHPAWGLSTIELADMDGDGQMDILACNGDNGDYTGHLPPMRPYHGFRIYKNLGKGKFTEAFFLSINGCYKAMAADFDLDGDQDLAIISFYPDYRRSPRESFLYLENVKGQFRAFSFEAAFSGRWITMDVGDVDGDGAPDIVLGAHNAGPTFVPGTLRLKWDEVGPSLVVLRNTIKKGSGKF